MWLIGDKIADRYEVHQILAGGMGIVYVCYDHEWKIPIVLKTFRESLTSSDKLQKMFRREALIWIELDKYPFVVRAFWVNEIECQLFIALEYVTPDAQGRNTLTHYLGDRLSLDAIVKISLQFCYGMKYAYSRGLDAHRDIKPDNIMIVANGTTKITDFGLAKAFSETELESDYAPPVEKPSLSIFRSKGKRICGTLPYMAPEQFDGRADIKSDIYSFGIVLFQMAAQGKLPFIARRFPEYEVLHRNGRVPSIFHPLLPVIQKCLRKDPWERYQNFTMLKEDLRKLYRRKTGRKFRPPRIKTLEPEELYNKGVAFCTLRRFQDAVACFDKVLRKKPQDTQVWLDKGMALSELNKNEDALGCFAEALKLNSELMAAWFAKGTILNKLERFNEAVCCFEKAARIEPRNASVWYNMGNSYCRLEMFDKAAFCYEKVIEIDPTHVKAWFQRGRSYGALDCREEAIRCFRKALELDPKNAKVWFGKALAEDELGRLEDAVQSYRHFLKLKPEGRGDGIKHAYQRLKELAEQ